MRERKCIVRNQVLPAAELLRFVINDDGMVLPDIHARAPGRGVWVTADRSCIEQACKKVFSRGFKRNACVPADLAEQVELQLRRFCLDLMALARRSGDLLGGYEKVRSEIRKARPGWIIEAKDGSEGGREKILALCLGVWDEVPLVGCFDAGELGKVFGQSHANHVLMHSGAIASNLGLQLQRLSGFTPIIPLQWGKWAVESW